MRTFLGLVMVLSLSTPLWAQEGPEQEDCSCLTDSSCAEISCTGTDNCDAMQFQVRTTGTYVLRSRVLCPAGSSCYQCQACVNIYQGSQYLYNCHNANCDNEHECEHTCNVNLTRGVTYTLYVCKSYCTGYSCDDCGSACVAEGCVSSTSQIPCQ